MILRRCNLQARPEYNHPERRLLYLTLENTMHQNWSSAGCYAAEVQDGNEVCSDVVPRRATEWELPELMAITEASCSCPLGKESSIVLP